MMNKLLNEECDHYYKVEICGTSSCAKCYLDELMSSKDRAPRNIKVEVVYDIYKHMVVIKKGRQ